MELTEQGDEGPGRGRPAERLATVKRLIAREPRADDAPAGMVGELQLLCSAAARSLPASGVGVSVITDSGVRGVAATSDASYHLLEELQFTLGEGPCMEAHASGRPVLEPDLMGAGGRWPSYAPGVCARGVRAVFSFPLRVGSARLGVLDVFRQQSGSMSKQALSQAGAYAEVAVTTLISAASAPGDGADDPGWEPALENRYELYQAQGMVCVQLGVGLDEAMARLRAYAYAEDQRLGEVARDVVARRLVFGQDDGP